MSRYLKFLQFLLWENCSNECEFCLFSDRHFSMDGDKVVSIEKATEIINSPDIMSKYDGVGFIGGEIFEPQPPLVIEKWLSM